MLSANFKGGLVFQACLKPFLAAGAVALGKAG
jgi:hypothetical protein